MAYEQRDNSGSLFVNNRKEKETHPDRTGKAMIGGVMYYVNGWLKKTGEGETWLSLSFKPIEGGSQPAKKKEPEAEADYKFGSDTETPF